MSLKLMKELHALSVPAVGAEADCVALGGRYKTETGQWVVDRGEALWRGRGRPTLAPSAALVSTITDVLAAHVPEPKRRVFDPRKIIAKVVLNLPLTQEERAEVESWLTA